MPPYLLPFLSRHDFLLPFLLLLLLLFLSRTNCVSFTTLTLFSRDRNGTYFLVKEVLSFLLHFPSLSSLSLSLSVFSFVPCHLLSSSPLLDETYFKMSSGNVAAASRIPTGMKYVTAYYIPPSVTLAKR